MSRLWWASTQDELPRPRWRAPQRYEILYTLFGVYLIWWGCSKVEAPINKHYGCSRALTPHFPCDPNWIDCSLGKVLTTKHVAFCIHTCGCGIARVFLCGDHRVPYHNITSLAFSFISMIIGPAILGVN